VIRRISGDSNPHVEQVGVSKLWQFVSEWAIDIHGVVFTFLPGFQYDRSSIPSIVPTWIISKDSLGCAAPAVHDALYRYRGDITPDTDEALVSLTPHHRYTRAETDKVFREILVQRGVPSWRAWAAWAGVRVGNCFKQW